MQLDVGMELTFRLVHVICDTFREENEPLWFFEYASTSIETIHIQNPANSDNSDFSNQISDFSDSSTISIRKIGIIGIGRILDNGHRNHV